MQSSPSISKNAATKIHRHLVLEIVESLNAIFNLHQQADKVIEKVLSQHRKWGSRDRRFFAETIYEIVRWQRRLLYMIKAADNTNTKGGENNKSIDKQDLWNIWAVYWLTSRREVLPKDWPELQNFPQKTAAEFLTDLQSCPDPAIQHSFSDWFYQYGLQQWGPDDWSSIAQALNQPAEVFIRANRLKTNVLDLQKQLQQENILSEKVGASTSDALKLLQRQNIFSTKAFQTGLFELQDAGSQMIAPLLAVQPGFRVIDACAGAGGKSLHLASLMGNKGKIIALDIYEWKLNELKKRARRGGVDIIETRVVDSQKVIKRLHGTADALLLDVPCTGSGVLRRNPDAKWKISLERLTALKQTQQDILQQYSLMTKIKGLMVYATCSIFKDENDQQVQYFLQQNKNWQLEKELVLRPDQQGYDGFYAAVLRRLA
ncbi:MAG: RsmB/NOP family class I SAM-dependent RNA methyltransferase [Pseudobdellovibrionaceae bacterium]